MGGKGSFALERVTCNVLRDVLGFLACDERSSAKSAI